MGVVQINFPDEFIRKFKWLIKVLDCFYLSDTGLYVKLTETLG